MLEDEEQNGSTGRKVEVKLSSKETVNTSNGGLYYKVAISSWKGCDLSGL